jgi:hypothetical protein
MDGVRQDAGLNGQDARAPHGDSDAVGEVRLEA